MKRHANTLIREGLERWPEEEPIAFFCECADEHCYQTVWLTRGDYDRARDDPDWVALAHGHRAAVAKARGREETGTPKVGIPVHAPIDANALDHPPVASPGVRLS